MRSENCDWFRELGADRGRHLIRFPGIISDVNETSAIFATNSRREGAAMRTASPEENYMVTRFLVNFFLISSSSAQTISAVSRSVISMVVL